MTVVLTFDAILGYALLVNRQDFQNQEKNYQALVNKNMSMIADNWKNQQFRNNNASEKVAAFCIVSFEMIFALSALFTFSGVQ
jgi:type IV secretory pathway component VirB8